MNNAKLYHKANTVQKRDANQILDEFSHLFNWRFDGTDSLLDIGTGTGDLLVEYIIPKMPKNFAKVIGVDVSEVMTEYASDKYRSKYVDFYKVNIESDLFAPELTYSNKIKSFLSESMALGNYDFITSFYCLHWIQNQRQAISNIYKLLKANGTCLMGFLVKHPFYDAYFELSRTTKYMEYMYDIRQYTSPYYFEEKPLDVMKKYLQDAGFKKYHVEIKNKTFIFDNLEILKSSVKAVNPYYQRMPLKLQEDFLNDCVVIIQRFSLNWIIEMTPTNGVNISYKLMVINATT